MSVGSGPPANPPQLSPDGRWIWDGQKWQPVPVVVGDVAGVARVAAAAAAPAPTPVAVAYAPPQVQAPVIPYAVPAAEVNEAPLWQEPAPKGGIQGLSLLLFAGAAVVVLIMAMMALNAMQIIQMPWQSDREAPVKVTASPTPQLPVRSEYARADRFVNTNLSPAVADLSKTLPAVLQSCNGTLTTSCQTAIVTSAALVKKVLLVIDRGDIPPCIAPGMTRIRADFAQIDDGLQIALKGYTDNVRSEVIRGLNRFVAADPAMQADAKATDLAMKTQCSTEPTGP
jgi:hypothetical protein